jgi:hypothetical protein
MKYPKDGEIAPISFESDLTGMGGELPPAPPDEVSAKETVLKTRTAGVRFGVESIGRLPFPAESFGRLPFPFVVCLKVLAADLEF